MKKTTLFFVLTFLAVLVFASCKSTNPTGPTPACALCAQETKTAAATQTAIAATQTAEAELGTATATQTATNIVVVNTATSTATATQTATNVVVVNTATSTATATVTVTVVSNKWSVWATGTPGDNFTFNYCGTSSDGSTIIDSAFSGVGTIGLDGKWNSNDVYTIYGVTAFVVDEVSTNGNTSFIVKKNDVQYGLVKQPAANIHWTGSYN